MFRSSTKWTALLGSALLLASSLAAQDSKALIDALIRKGVLTAEEAKGIQDEIKKTAPVVAVPGSKEVTKLTLGARVQAQYAALSTDIDGTSNDPASTNHFFVRRLYLVTKASMGSNWSVNVTFDAAEQIFDAAVVTFKNSDFTIDAGLRKAPLGYEELTSSGSLKAIERSGVTRYFVEPNNGRRLGASSYRIGIFGEGKTGNIVYGAAITNPERVDSSTSNGNAGNNQQAFYGHLAYKDSHATGNFAFGGAVGFLPDQGGKTLGAGNDLTVYSLFGDVTFGDAQIVGEYLWADNDRGASATQDASPSGFWIQGSYKFTSTFEGVVRMSSLDSDGRGVNISDGVRSAPSGGTHDKLTEYFIGGNWYIKGNDLKLQAGYVHGESDDTVTGADAGATASGFRSMMQLNF
jgi:phosphate-selective porin